MGEGNLELVGGEEAAGARVLAVAEANVLDGAADQVGALLLLGAAHVEEAVAVVLEGVLVVLGVPHVDGGADELLALLEGHAVLELNVREDAAAPRGFSGMLVRGSH